MNENDARALIERFAKKQRDRHFACPRCGKMTMDAECVTRNALSRRPEIYVCDACGTQEAIEDMMARKVTGVDFVKALDRAGFPDVAHNIYNMLRQKVAGDYLHTASIFDEQFHVLSAVNVPNEYHGPMTGYQISEERWNQLKNIPNAIRPEDI